ncbi:MAG TPA: hypothetical protein VGI12_20030 [Vicinamibacterales bacterium]|jgi:hypothetical protein
MTWTWATRLWGPPASGLTRARIRAAYAVAAATDILQFLLGPLGWVFADEILDVATMIVVSVLIGFHPLLLPTFVIEFVPVADLLPTWTGCVALLIAVRRRQVPPAEDDRSVPIDVKPTKVE